MLFQASGVCKGAVGDDFFLPSPLAALWVLALAATVFISDSSC